MTPGTLKLRYEPADGVGARDVYLVPALLRDLSLQGWVVCDDASSCGRVTETEHGVIWFHRARSHRRGRGFGVEYGCWAFRATGDAADVRRGSQLATRDGAALALLRFLRESGRLRPPVGG